MMRMRWWSSLAVAVCFPLVTSLHVAAAAPDPSVLTKPDVEATDRTQALKDLAKAHNTTPLDELLAALDRPNAGPAARDLADLLAHWDAGEVKASRAKVERVIASAKLPVVRQGAFAALLAADGSADAAWALAGQSPRALPDLLAALARSFDADLLDKSYDRILAALRNPPAEIAPDARRAAAQAAAMVKGKEPQTFAALADLVRKGTDVPAGLAGLDRLPAEKLPREQLNDLVVAAIAHLQKLPPDQRTSPGFVASYAATRDLAGLLPESDAKQMESSLAALGVKSIVVKSVPTEMRFDPDVLTVEAGRPVEVVLQNPDMMPHNFLVTIPGAMEDVGMLGEAMAGDPKGFDKGFVPDSPKVLHASRLLQPNEAQHLAFVAPEKPGEYPYVCTFPGHWRTMNGVMKVTEPKK